MNTLNMQNTMAFIMTISIFGYLDIVERLN